MLKVKIFDGIFSHNPYSCLNCVSEYFEWDVNPSEINDGDIVFFTEHSFEKAKELAYRDIKRIAWLIESPVILDQSIIFNYIDIFDEVYTLRKDFLELSPKFKFLPVWGSWIKYGDRKIYDKNKNLSIIASYKRQTVGHNLRHTIISLFHNNMDVFGSGYKSIEDKVEGLIDYRFSLVIENTKQDYYFTEKLLDCFNTGTVPIYWGCPSIGDFFDSKGILNFDSLDDLHLIIESLSPEKYLSMKENIANNYVLANKYKTPEDYLINYDILK